MHLTDWLLIAWMLVAVAYDVWAYLTFGSAATISYRFRAWVNYCPWILLPLGALFWHLLGTRWNP